MTSTPSTSSEPIYPTEWHTIDSVAGVDCRQLSLDTYQLKSEDHTVTLNKEGFSLSRDNSPQGRVIFHDWCARNKIEPEPWVADNE